MEASVQVSAALMQNGQIIDAYVFTVTQPGDLSKGATAAFDYFRKAHPGVALFDPGIEIKFSL
jgi:hypothetical protein